MLCAELVCPAGDHLILRDRRGGASPSPDLSGPWLFGNPFERVEPIGSIEVERHIFTFGTKAPTAILGNKNKSPAHRLGADCIRTVFVIGRAQQNDWKPV